MAEQLELFPEWVTDDSIEINGDEYGYWVIFSQTDSELLESIGCFLNKEEAEKAMIEYDGEMVLKATLSEVEVFLKHNNKTVVH